MNMASTVRTGVMMPLVATVGLLALGILGQLSAAWGYGFFLVAVILLGSGTAVFSIYVFTQSYASEPLQRIWSLLFILGGWSYIWAVGALSGYFVREAIDGRMETKWVLFGPAALAALIAVEWGLYRLLVVKNLPTWRRFGHVVTREASDPAATRRTFVDDVLLHRSLLSVSGFRWLRHTLIFWGFVAMFVIEILAVILREVWPAFGGTDVWENPTHPLRLAFDLGYELTGAMVLLGCVMALVWRVMVNGTPEQKFSDTPSAVFLLLVVASGFVVEAMRLAELPPDPAYWFSFLGYGLSGLWAGSEPASMAHEALWYIHVFGSCAFIAYVPAKRLVHSCATPMGRLMISQKGLLAAKRRSILAGLMGGQEND